MAISISTYRTDGDNGWTLCRRVADRIPKLATSSGVNRPGWRYPVHLDLPNQGLSMNLGAIQDRYLRSDTET